MKGKAWFVGILVIVVAAIVGMGRPVESASSTEVTATIWVNRQTLECGERSQFVAILTVNNPGPAIPGVDVSLSTPTHQGNSRLVAAAPEATEIRGDYVDWNNITLSTGRTYFVVITESDQCIPLYDWGGAAQAVLVRREPWQILAQAWIPQTKVVHKVGKCGFDWGVEIDTERDGDNINAVLTVENQFGIRTSIWLIVGWGSLTPKELPDGWVQVDDDYAFGWTPRIEDGGTVEIPITFEISEKPWDWWVIVAEGGARTIPGATYGWTNPAAREMTERDIMAMYDAIRDQPHLQPAAAMIKQRLEAVKQTERQLQHLKEITTPDQ